MVGDAIEYYEVSKVSGGADTSSPCCLSKASDFLCTDFTADLSVSLTEGAFFSSNELLFFILFFLQHKTQTVARCSAKVRRLSADFGR